ncbi:MAG: hypothetical protein ACR2FN_03165 [Chitinophagaceae bacterium]
MDKIATRKLFLPLFFVFIFISSLCRLLSNWLVKQNIDPNVVLVANALLFALAMVSTYMHYKAMKNKNPNVFIRSVTASTIIKLLIIAGSVLAYFYFAKENKSSYAIITAMGLYVIYTVIEVNNASKMNKIKHDSN